MVFTFLNLPGQTVQIQIPAISLRGPTLHYVAIHGLLPPTVRAESLFAAGV